MHAKYTPGQYSKIHFENILEICNLREYYDMPCKGCIHNGLQDCPKVRGAISDAVMETTVQKSFASRKKRNG